MIRTQIPFAECVFTVEKKVKTIYDHLAHWLDTEVYETILDTQPKVSTTKPYKIIGDVSIRCPEFYYSNKKEFETQVKETLKSIGYDVEFGDDGYGEHQMCYIKWSVKQ